LKRAVTIAPSTATPSAPPTWRLVLIVADATPACPGGIPAIAAATIGEMVSPSPSPSSISGPSSSR
jgi:hypothetical protein